MGVGGHVCGALLMMVILDASSALPQQQYLQPEKALEALDVLTRYRRAVGGEDLDIEDWPWLVHVEGKMISSSLFGIPLSYAHYYCGGVLLDYDWVLTAAHCFNPTPRRYSDQLTNPSKWHFKAGRNKAHHHAYNTLCARMGWEWCAGWKYHASRIIEHPDYNQQVSEFRNDLAMVKLEKKYLTDRSYIKPATLPDDSTIPAGEEWPADQQECYFKGWGCTKSGGGPTDKAQVVKLPKLSDTECTRAYGWGIDLSTTFCAGAISGNIGICAGDSGGPLVCDKAGRWVLSGVASFSVKDEPGDYPGGFTRVRSYVSWIQQVMSTN